MFQYRSNNEKARTVLPGTEPEIKIKEFMIIHFNKSDNRIKINKSDNMIKIENFRWLFKIKIKKKIKILLMSQKIQ